MAVRHSRLRYVLYGKFLISVCGNLSICYKIYTVKAKQFGIFRPSLLVIAKGMCSTTLNRLYCLLHFCRNGRVFTFACFIMARLLTVCPHVWCTNSFLFDLDPKYKFILNRIVQKSMRVLGQECNKHAVQSIGLPVQISICEDRVERLFIGRRFALSLNISMVMARCVV